MKEEKINCHSAKISFVKLKLFYNDSLNPSPLHTFSLSLAVLQKTRDLELEFEINPGFNLGDD